MMHLKASKMYLTENCSKNKGQANHRLAFVIYLHRNHETYNER